MFPTSYSSPSRFSGHGQAAFPSPTSNGAGFDPAMMGAYSHPPYGHTPTTHGFGSAYASTSSPLSMALPQMGKSTMPMHSDYRTAVPPPPQQGVPIVRQSSATAVSPSDSTSERHSGITPLRRGQACQACRRRKLKCDAVRPVCGTCTKSRKAAALANHASPVPDGDCVYDDGPVTSQQQQSATSPVSGVPTNATSENGQSLGESDRSTHKRQRTTSLLHDGRAAAEHKGKDGRERGNRGGAGVEAAEQKAARLEARVLELEERLRQVHGQGGSNGTEQLSGGARPSETTASTPNKWRSRASSREPEGDYTFRPSMSIVSMLSPLSGREERHRMRYSHRPAGSDERTLTDRSPLRAEVMISPTDGKQDKEAGSGPSTTQMGTTSLADPTLVDGAFDATAKVGSTTSANDESFMQLLWPGWSSDLPSAETVTSLCETFFRLHPLRTMVYKPSFMAGLLLPVRHPHRPHDALIHAILSATADISPFHDTTGIPNVRNRFLEMVSPLARPNAQQPQLDDVLTFKEYHLSKARRKIERSILTDFRNPLDWLCGALVCCYVLWNEGRFVEAYFLSGLLGRMMAPTGLDKLPSRHHTKKGAPLRPAPGLFGDAQGLEENERRIAFWHAYLADQYTSGPTAFYENMIHEEGVLIHLPCRVVDFAAGKDVAPNVQTLASPDLFTTGHLDEFTVHIKSASLLRRVGTLISRSQMLRTKPPGVVVMDRHVDDFLRTFPTTPWFECTSDGLNAFANISLALFYLHEPYMSRSSLCTIKEARPKPTSANGRILLGVGNLMEMLHQLYNSSLDFALLHPQMFLTWGVCARMLGKDMVLLQRSLQRRMNGAVGSVVATGTPTVKEDGHTQLVDDEQAALSHVIEGLDLIIAALARAGVKSIKAKRCSELVTAVRNGHIHEAFLAHLLYLDGVIPVDHEDTTSTSSDPTADLGAAMTTLSQDPAFSDFLQAGSLPSGGLNSIPLMMSMMNGMSGNNTANGDLGTESATTAAMFDVDQFDFDVGQNLNG